MPARKFSNDTTVQALENWTEAQKTTERLAAAILHLESYTKIEPSHPTGGRDTGKDIVCCKDNKTYVAAVSFNRDKQSISNIQKKFSEDFNNSLKHNPKGFIYFTNQRLTIQERNKLTKLIGNDIEIVLYPLETIAAILSTPKGYGVRLEYLGVEMSKEEQVAFFTAKDEEINILSSTLKELLSLLEKVGGMPLISTDKLNEFKRTLEMITGDSNHFNLFGSSMIDRLKVPIDDLKKYHEVLNQILNFNNIGFFTEAPNQKLAVPLEQIASYYQTLLNIRAVRSIYPDPLAVPTNELENYNRTLDNTIAKLREINRLKKENGI